MHPFHFKVYHKMGYKKKGFYKNKKRIGVLFLLYVIYIEDNTLQLHIAQWLSLSP